MASIPKAARIGLAGGEKPAVTVAEEVITPAKAEVYLANNVENRVMRPWIAEQYRRAMAQGEWHMSGEAIKFSNTGRLLDGQHRLRAIVDCGIPQRFLVVRGLDEAAHVVMDSGVRRSTGDRLGALGEINVNILAGALTWIVLFVRTGAIRRHGWVRPSPMEVKQVLEEHPGLRESASFAAGSKLLRQLMAAPLIAALHYLFTQRNPQLAEQFWTALRDGIGLNSEEPVYRLRERLLVNRGSRAKLPVSVVAALAIKAWNASVTGQQIKLLRFSSDEEFPAILPIIKE